MKFDELDAKMRVYETAHDRCVVPGMYIIARIDGRGFTRLTKETHKFKAPFDEKFRDLMIGTTQHLMNCGFNIIFGYTESDEISLLFDLNENAFGRKHRKYNSLLAGEASAVFTSMLGSVGVFDCRICEIPNKELVVDYFRWRNEDAFRNALNAHCYWRLRKERMTPQTAAKKIEKMSTAEKNELLFSYGINFNDLPAWQKRGIGLYWEKQNKEGYNPKTNKKVLTERRGLRVELDLPMKDKYSKFIEHIIALNEPKKKK